MIATLRGTSSVRQVLLAVGFAVGFVAAYLSTVLLERVAGLPTNVWIGGTEGLLLRPEPVLIPLAVAFGLPAVAGTSAGVLAHNLLFRLGPGGVTAGFSVAQTLVVLLAGLLAILVRKRVPRPVNNLVLTWLLSAFLILGLGTYAAVEYQTPVVEEWVHIFREVLVPINVLGLLLLEAVTVRGRARGGGAGGGVG